MIINGFLFFWLVVFAIIGIFVVLIGGVGMLLAWLQYTGEDRKEQREYE